MGPASILGVSDPDEPNGGTRSTPNSAARRLQVAAALEDGDWRTLDEENAWLE
jgi:hypothetical protein